MPISLCTKRVRRMSSIKAIRKGLPTGTRKGSLKGSSKDPWKASIWEFRRELRKEFMMDSILGSMKDLRQESGLYSEMPGRKILTWISWT